MILLRSNETGSNRFDHLLGVGLVFTVALIWTVATFVSQDVVSEVDPLLFTYLGNTLFTFYLPVALANKWIKRKWKERRSRDYQLVQPELDFERDAANDASLSEEAELEQDASAFNAALWVAPFWFLANWFYNMSFLSTSATSNAILSQTSTLFTYALSVWLLRESYSNVKLLYVFVTILGVALVAFKDHEESTKTTGKDRSIMGDIACIMGACFYGLYAVLMRKKLGSEHNADVAMFFGYIGLLTTLVVTPLIALLVFIGIYKREDVAISRRNLGLIAGEGLIDNIIADFLLAKAVLLIGPTLAALGMASTIPLTALGDVLLRFHQHTSPPAWVRSPGLLALTLSGTLCVLAGFLGFNHQPSRQEEEQEQGVELREELEFSRVGSVSPVGSVGSVGSPAWSAGSPVRSVGRVESPQKHTPGRREHVH